MPTDGLSWRSLDAHSLRSVALSVSSDSCSLWLTDLDRYPGIGHDSESCLDATDWERASAKPEGLARERFVTSRVLLRQILAAALDANPSSLRFELDTHGKPRLGDPYQHCHFNLSHSGSVLLLGLSTRAALGVDIELPRVVPRAAQLAQRVFSTDEQELLERSISLSETARDDTFMRIWTRKEAYLKYRGSGFATPAREYAVGIHDRTILDDIEIRSIELPIEGYAALAMALPLPPVSSYLL